MQSYIIIDKLGRKVEVISENIPTKNHGIKCNPPLQNNKTEKNENYYKRMPFFHINYKRSKISNYIVEIKILNLIR